MMKSVLVLACFAATLLVVNLHSQPFSKRYLMACHSCDSNCSDPQSHVLHILQSPDAIHWKEVPNVPRMQGSVPSILARDSNVYVYTPSLLRRYSIATHRWETRPYEIRDSLNNPVRIVDPSAYWTSDQRIALFFLNSSDVPPGQDPAGCSSYPCVKNFDAALEVPGSKGERFVLVPGHRLQITLQNGTASDPDVSFEWERWVMLVSRGQNTSAYSSFQLLGSYKQATSLADSRLAAVGVAGMGAQPNSAQRAVYGQRMENGHNVICMADCYGLDTLLDNSRFRTIIRATDLGLSAQSNVESPSLCFNMFFSDSLAPIVNSSNAWKRFFTLNPNEGRSFRIDTNAVAVGGVPRLHIVDSTTIVLGYSPQSMSNSAGFEVSNNGLHYESNSTLNIRGDGGYVYLPDGRIRYITEEPTSTNTQQRHKSHIVSYISYDGFRFSREAGVRYTPGDVDDSIAGVPSVIQVRDSIWRMYYVGDWYRTNGARTAISHDWGMTWTPESTGNVLRNDDVDPQPVYLSNGSMRLYFRASMKSSKSGGIAYCDSPDGLHFDTSAIHILLPDTLYPSMAKLDPSVIKFDNGRIACYFGAAPQQGSSEEPKLMIAWDNPGSVDVHEELTHTAEQLIVHPQPADEYLIVELGELKSTATISVVNSLGQVVQRQTTLNPDLFIRLDDLVPSVYTLICDEGTRIRRSCFVKHN